MRRSVEDGIFWTSVRDDPVLNHPTMMYQRGRKQLGQIEAIFPGANHSRFDHAIIATGLVHDICDVLETRGRLPCARSDIVRYTQIHDIGHAPFSHAVEYVLRGFTNLDHHQHGLRILESTAVDKAGRTLADVLSNAGADVDVIRSLFTGSNCAASICSDKTLGADKLAYTYQDAKRMDFDQLPPDSQQLIPYYTFMGGKLGLDIRNSSMHSDNPIARAVAMQQFYFRMYTEGYLSSRSLAFERHIQVGVEQAIRAGIFTANDIWELADDALIHEVMRQHSNEGYTRAAKEAIRRFIERDPYEPAIALKYDEFKIDRFTEEAVHVIAPSFAKEFLRTFSNPLRLSDLEAQLSADLRSPVLISVLPDPEKVNPGNIPLYRNGSLEGTLEEIRPDHFNELRERVKQFFAIRVLVPRSEQDRISRAEDEYGPLVVTRATEYFNRT